MVCVWGREVDGVGGVVSERRGVSGWVGTGVGKAEAAWVRKCRVVKSSEAVTNGCVERKRWRRCVGVPRRGRRGAECDEVGERG